MTLASLRRLGSLACLVIGAFLSMATSYATWRRDAALQGAVDVGPEVDEVRVPILASIDAPTELDYMLVEVEVRIPITWEGAPPQRPDVVLVDDATGETLSVEWGTTLQGSNVVGTVGPIFACEGQKGPCDVAATLLFTPRAEVPVHVDWTATASTSAMGDDPGGAVLILE